MEEAVDVAVVGAGPAGLSCAIEAQKAGLDVTVFEQGALLDAMRRFPTNLVWFSTPELLEIGGIPFITPSVRPTRIDVLNYYQHVARQYRLSVRAHDAVRTIVPSGKGFTLGTASGGTYAAANVVVATGYFDTPNRLDVPGEDLPHVFHYYDEPFRYFGDDVAVVGGRNSAVEAALDLYRHGVRVTLIHRGERLSDGVKYWILPDIENRIKAGEIRALYATTVRRIEPGAVTVADAAGERRIDARYVFVLIGFRPDVALMRTFGIEVEPDTLAPRHDPATYETAVPGLYVAGSVVAGRLNNKIFVENGR
ncbi:MAG TPA: YpdA family putative bacillithiol disulfide reductase, partial [Bacteroidota bacterium]|nr:YpdA family putative bacillithiol disulfide reductase [Bacteroidota bacterium]